MATTMISLRWIILEILSDGQKRHVQEITVLVRERGRTTIGKTYILDGIGRLKSQKYVELVGTERGHLREIPRKLFAITDLGRQKADQNRQIILSIWQSPSVKAVG